MSVNWQLCSVFVYSSCYYKIRNNETIFAEKIKCNTVEGILRQSWSPEAAINRSVVL